jgi:ketosteroid isomerase-like protein
MRHTARLLVLSLLALGCYYPYPYPPPAPQPSPAPDNAAVVQRLYESFARGDVSAVLGALASNVTWREADNSPYADRNPYIGPQAVAEGVFARLANDFADFRVTTDQIVAKGDVVVATGRYGGTARATGKPLDAQFAHVWRLRDGKVVSFQQYTDTRQFQLQFANP